jgi:hypothetical protein
LIRGETHYQDCSVGTRQAHQRCTLANKEKRMNLPKENLPSSPRKNRKLALILGGMTILGMLALIGLVLLSNFPGPTQGSADKSEAPPEDVSKAKP